MKRRDPELTIRQILDHAREAVTMAAGRHRENLDEDRQLELALTRLLEIVGEAANRLPPAHQALYPSVPWPEIISLRNRLIHGYDSVDLDVLWSVVRIDLPNLIAELDRGD